MRKLLLIFGIILSSLAYSAEQTGVVNKETGDLLRAGYVSTNSWLTDGSFNTNTEQVVTGVPHPPQVYDVFDTNGWHRFTTNTWAIFNPPMTNRVAEWNLSKTNHQHIIDWENASAFRLGQLNAIFTGAGLITNDLTFAEISPAIIADYTRQAGPTSPSVSVSIALEECVKFAEGWILELIGPPPDRSEISKHIKAHE